MKKTKEKGFSRAELEAMTVSQRQIAQRDIVKERFEVVKEIERLLTDISKKKAGKSLQMRNPKRLGHRPNDIFED